MEIPIWPEDIRTTAVANIKKEAESPRPKDVRPITLAATLYCVVEYAIQRNDDVAPQDYARRNPRSQSVECYSGHYC